MPPVTAPFYQKRQHISNRDKLICDSGRVPGDIANVDCEHPAGMLLDDLPVDLRVMLAAVADQDERQVGVQRQHVADQLTFVILGLARKWPLPGEAPFAQEQDGTDRDAMQGEEGIEDVVDPPWRTRDVEHGIALVAGRAGMKAPVEGG